MGPLLENICWPVLFVAEDNARLAEVVGCHLHIDLVAFENADAELAHLACRMGQDFVTVLQFHLEHGVGQPFQHRSGKLE